MNYVFTFNEINYGRIEMEADHKPDNIEIIEKILEGKADYNETDFIDFRLIEMDGEDLSDSFKVTITEKLQRVVTVDADSPDEAEQMVSDNWRAGDYILDAENFVGVDFAAVPMVA